MPDNGSTDYEGAAKATVALVDHEETPDQVSDAVLEKLIVMADESQINIWHKQTGLSIESLRRCIVFTRQAQAIDVHDCTGVMRRAE